VGVGGGLWWSVVVVVACSDAVAVGPWLSTALVPTSKTFHAVRIICYFIIIIFASVNDNNNHKTNFIFPHNMKVFRAAAPLGGVM
jgi:hypothetical protein